MRGENQWSPFLAAPSQFISQSHPIGHQTRSLRVARSCLETLARLRLLFVLLVVVPLFSVVLSRSWYPHCK